MRAHNSSASPAGGNRRRSSNAPLICAGVTAVLLLLSLAVLHSRLSLSFNPTSKLPNYPSSIFDDAENDAFDGPAEDDRIDVLDLDDSPKTRDNDDEPESDEDPQQSSKPEPDASALFWDHSIAVHRRSFGKPEFDPDPETEMDPNQIYKITFSSDDQPLGDHIRSKLHSVNGIEDMLMIKTGADNPLRDGWAHWLEGKGDFLRRDKMLKSNLELLNPKNHPLLQDPDVVGLNSYTRSDRLVQKSILKEMEKTPFPVPSREGIRSRRSLQLRLEKDDVNKSWEHFWGIDERGHLSFLEFVERFFGTG